MLNGQYQGIYQLGEKVKISKGRVDIGDNGILVEIDALVLGVRQQANKNAGGKQDGTAHHFMILIVLPPVRSR